jgi:hypothetical protein
LNNLDSEINTIKIKYDNEFKFVNNFLDFYDILDIKTIIDDRNRDFDIYKFHKSKIQDLLEK